MSAGILLGFDTYSLRAFNWTATQLLDYTAQQKLDAIQISSLDPFESFEPAYLAKVKEQAARLGIVVDAGIGCIGPTSVAWNAKYGSPAEYLAKGLRIAKAIGATSMRCYMGNSNDRLTKPMEQHIEATVAELKKVRSLALDLGVKVAVENHSGDMQAWELRTLIEEAGKDYVAACLDTGNPLWVVEDPMVTLEVLGPYTVTTHIRDSVVFEYAHGAAAQWVALGDGVIDFKKFVARFRQLCPNATMQLENITGRPPRLLPYLDREFWKAFPKAKADEFARFVELARKGRPFMGYMVVEDGMEHPPAEFTAALKQQQRVDLERGFEYAKKTLGVGVRWQQ